MSDHGARALVLAALALVGGGALLWGIAGRPDGLERLAAAAATAPAGAQLVVDDHVERDWETLHVFAPSTPPHLVEEAVGSRVREVRGLLHEEVLLLVLTRDRGSIVASGLVSRAPVDWLPLTGDQPYGRDDAIFNVVATEQGTALHRAQLPSQR
jgi:hypothetical protein